MKRKSLGQTAQVLFHRPPCQRKNPTCGAKYARSNDDFEEYLKHKAILTTIYSAGLRIIEVINLKIKDIDSDRMQIRIEQGKGKVDRYILLSAKTPLLFMQPTNPSSGFLRVLPRENLT